MSTILFKRSNTAGNDGYTGTLGEITIDSQARRIRIHDGVLAGGHEVANMDDVQELIDNISGLEIADINGLQAALDSINSDISSLQTGKADKTVNFTAGNGITGGGTLAANRTFTLGTPSTLDGASTNAVTATSHSHAINVTQTDVGLSNVDNTADADKPVSGPQQTALNLKVNNSEKGVADGVATLDAGGKVPISQISDTVLGQVEYMGSWNAATNTPTLPTTPEKKGDYYVVNTAGDRFGMSFNVGDWIISNGTAWEKVDNTDQVVSVNGKIGAVVITKGDVDLGNVDNTADVNKPVSGPQQTALNLKANIDSPSFTGTPTAPTPDTSDDSTKLATTAYVKAITDAMNTGVSSVAGTGAINITGTAANPIVGISLATTTDPGAMSAADKTKLNSVESGAQVNTVDSVAGKTGVVTLVKSDVGLSNVQNYGVASEAVAITGESTTTYSTPKRVRDFVENGDYTIDGGTF